MQRIEARLSAEQRAKIEHAAAIAGEALSTFLVNSAAARADQLIAAETTTFLPAEYFDRLLASLDDVAVTSGLDATVRRLGYRPER
ncbi:MAG TPA: DUF1778 domain-containing protein [Acidimicrobiales bacterium]|nr:DUF1778 domain-containing protein [Acidimicrobiales bacterium]